MTFLFAYGAAPARRAALCALALLVLALGSTAVASAADGATGTVVVQQVAVGGSPAPGGCYTITRTDGPDPGFWSYRCDQQRQRRQGRRGVVADLPVGSYRLAGGRAAGRVQAGAGHVLGAGARRRDRHGHPHARAAAAAARRHERPGRQAARRLLLADPRARRVRGLRRRGVRRRRRRGRRDDDVQDDPPGQLRDPPHGVAVAVPPARRRDAVRHARRRARR